MKIISSVRAKKAKVNDKMGIETTVVTKNGAIGINIASPASSGGPYEESFFYREEKNNEDLMQNEVRIINELVAPVLEGKDVTDQTEIDRILVNSFFKRKKIGSGSTSSISGAVVKAAAKIMGIPLYEYLADTKNQIIKLPIPLMPVPIADRYRYAVAGGKPTYAFACYGFKTINDAIHAGWEAKQKFLEKSRLGSNMSLDFRKTVSQTFFSLKENENANKVIEKLKPIYSKVFSKKQYSPKWNKQSDEIFLELMTDSILELGYKNKIGIMSDVAAGFYYNSNAQKYFNLFSGKEKSREELLEFYRDIISKYPVVLLEDPFEPDDFKSHQTLTKESGITIAADDLIGTDLSRLQKAISMGSCNSIVLKVNRIITVSDVLKTAKIAKNGELDILACPSRGLGSGIVDYAIALGAKYVKGVGHGALALKLLQVEKSLGDRAVFIGRNMIKL